MGAIHFKFAKTFRKFLSPRLNSQTAVWLGLALVSILTVFAQVTVRQARFWVNHTFEVLETIQQIEFSLLSSQTQFQIFLTDQDSEALTRYLQHIDAATVQVDLLQRQTVDNRSQQQRINDLKTSLERHLAQKQALIRAVQNNPATVATEQQVLLFSDEVQRRLGAILQEEKRLLQLRRDHANRQGTMASGIIFAGLGIVILFSWRTDRHQQKQRQVLLQLN